MYLSFNKMPLVQKTLSVASCVLFVVTIGLVLKTWKPFHDAPKTMALPALLQAVVTTPGIFSLAGLVSLASPLTHGVCAVAITVQLRGMLSSWCACISIVGGTVTEATDSLASAAEAAPDADTLPESGPDMEKQAAGAEGLKDKIFGNVEFFLGLYGAEQSMLVPMALTYGAAWLDLHLSRTPGRSA